jgi:hypothetical protein
VCKEWYRRSFQHLPAELADYRNQKLSKNDFKAKAVAYALTQYLKKREDVGDPVLDTAVGKFAKDMFTESAAHIKRWKEKGYILKPQTIDQAPPQSCELPAS